MNRRDFMGAVPAAVLLAQGGIARAPGKKGVMLLEDLMPLYIPNEFL